MHTVHTRHAMWVACSRRNVRYESGVVAAGFSITYN